MATKPQFFVKKTTVHHRQCTTCRGSGKVTRSGREGKCIDCVEGVAEITHMTEVTLMEALYELGLIQNR
jgi:hypothetical protein